MPIPQQRFTHYTTAIQQLVAKANKQANPALWLFQNDLRTPIFRLQGLARVYRKMHNEKTFEKINEKSKQLEDALGKVDYYTAFTQQFTKQKTIPKAVVDFCKQNTQVALQELNKVLEEEDWLNGKRISKIEKKLATASWLTPIAEKKAIENVFIKEIQKIEDFAVATTLEFDNIEEDVHELRRKLRWISIYALSLQGAAQLQTSTSKNTALKKYLTTEVINSPFNVMPKAPKEVKPIFLNKNAYYALSWLIAALGNIKDEGLKIAVIMEAYQKTAQYTEEKAMHTTIQHLGKKQPSMEQLLQKASALTKEFFTAQVLQHLVVKN